MLAQTYGGGPAYWLDPDLPDELIATAYELATRDRGKKP